MDVRGGAAGDMPAEEFRRAAHRVVDWIADYLERVGEYPVLARTAPGEIARGLPAAPPRQGEPVDAILRDVDEVILPGITHWNHPAFFGYFAITGSGPGILGEMLAAALNVNGMLWKTSPAATELEEVALGWLRQMVGLPGEFFGVIMDTASVASLCAIAAAREAVAEYPVRLRGLAGGPRLRLYTSEQAHSSVEKAALVLGLGQDGVRKIPTDNAFRMDPQALAEAVAEDRRQGWRPFCVAATVGTTSTTSIDPVPAIADVCEREGLWLHVDAAYAGMAAVAPEYRWVLDGCARADSVVINPHKWLFVPIDCSAFYCRRPEVLRRAFSLVPDYLRTPERDREGVRDLMDYGIQLGRRFRGLKLWMVIRYFGSEGVASRIRDHIALAQRFAAWVDAHPDFERMAPAPLSVVCFRAHPAGLRGRVGPETLDGLNADVLERVNATGRAFLSHTRLRGRMTLRLAVGNLRTTERHVRQAWDLIQEATAAAVRAAGLAR
ncbi:MAG: pyridoxal-dependent decarboxylase [Armatimonadota bacterium]|nr:pyridoxal-dependent decarboxylase [Armatimonadota bacterium]MDR7401056.1 pyridoxal-dependent decarboxylase [Armatimonadota bacterium]MDR7436351.1 pyridoxal-dependent decarboxylase [Armatimonadota bacterium]MDR7471161.1 pyridoxal-dependent decarboxylase [Armatimonadota bacterium]MDR7508291.1 pyridoxal-dependent decarboxylase [Armatimonadota bacterium]